jgi:hypothetical protein
MEVQDDKLRDVARLERNNSTKLRSDLLGLGSCTSTNLLMYQCDGEPEDDRERGVGVEVWTGTSY